MSTRLPESPNLEQLRKLAKDLRSLHRSRNPEAARRLSSAAKKFAASTENQILDARIPLATFQHTVALEYGFHSWTDLKESVIATNLTLEQSVKAFIDAAMRGKKRFCMRLLEKHSGIANYDLATAMVLGDLETLRAKYDKNPDCINASTGPFPWTPITYAVRSCFGKDSDHAEGVLACVKFLLSQGANPNTKWPCPFPGPGQWEKQPLLYAAVGIANNASIAEALLAAGAEPNDGESLYHSAEYRDLACMRTLLTAGSDPNLTPVLQRVLDYDDAAAVQLLLAAGADPNRREGTPEGVDSPLVHAIKHQASEESFRILMQAGADPSQTGVAAAELKALCSRYGCDPVILGLGGEMTPTEKFVNACALGDLESVKRIHDENVDLVAAIKEQNATMLPEMAKLGNKEAVRTLLAMDFDIEATGDWGGTAVHQAAWLGHASVVEVLLTRDPELEGVNAFGGTALGCALHGSVNAHSDGDYQAVTELLLGKGAKVLPDHLGMGADDCDDLVRSAND